MPPFLPKVSTFVDHCFRHINDFPLQLCDGVIFTSWKNELRVTVEGERSAAILLAADEVDGSQSER